MNWKQEKKDIKRQMQLADGIIKEDLYTAYYAGVWERRNRCRRGY